MLDILPGRGFVRWVQTKCSKRRTLICCLIPFLCAVVIYVPCVRYKALVWDDSAYVLWVRKVAPSLRVGDILNPSIFAAPEVERRYRPLPLLVLVWQLQSLGGRYPLQMRVVSCVLHGINAALIAFLAARIARSQVAGCVAGMFFAMHPAHIENVCTISQQDILLCTFFLLLVGLLLLPKTGVPVLGKILLACLLLICALLSQESALVMPALMVFGGLVLCQGKKWKENVVSIVPLWAIVLTYGVVRLGALDAIGDVASVKTSPLDLLSHGVLVARTVWSYLRQVTFPIGLVESTMLTATQVDMGVGTVLLTLSLLVLAALVAIVWVWNRRVGFGLIWFALALAPVTNILIIRGRMLGPSRLYFPLIGMSLALASLVALGRALRGRQTTRLIIWVSIVLILVIYSALTASGVRHYRSWRTFTVHQVRHCPDHPPAHHNLAIVLHLERRSAAAAIHNKVRRRYSSAAAGKRPSPRSQGVNLPPSGKE